MAKNEPQPDTRSAAYNKMSSRWELMCSVLGGTESMREAGSDLLPRHQEESDNSWERRLSLATLLNMTELTLDMLAGKPFSDPVTLSKDAPTEHVDWAEDVDLQGNNIDVFARRWFRDGLAKGLSHVLVDYPRVNTDQPRTLADDAAENVRPYLVHLPAESIIFMSGVMINGREVLDHVRISETEVVRQGWGEVVVERIRVLEPGTVQIWEKVVENRKEEWKMIDSWETSLDYIPLVTFYSDRQGLGIGKPPLLDLAYMNARHWQLEADLNNIISVACFPMLAMSGVDDTDTEGAGMMKLGPNQVLATRAADGRFYYVEHSGAAINTGMNQLSHIEDQMAAYGAQFLREKPGNLKATVRALDTAEALSQLQAITLGFKDALEVVLQMMSDWGGIKDSPGIEMSVEFGISDMDETGWQAIEEARKRREISRSQVILEMKRRGWLSDDYDAEEDMTELEREKDELMALVPELDLDPQQKDDPSAGQTKKRPSKQEGQGSGTL